MTINARNSPLFAVGKAKWDAFVASYTGPYNLSRAVYAGMNQKVEFGCPVHGTMAMDAKNMMAGKQCVACALAARSGKARFTQAKMLARFEQAHGARYDYTQAVYNGQQTPVTIVCSRHGAFEQKPEYHWSGSGCPQCFHEDKRGATQRDSTELFAEKLRGVFGDLFEIRGEYQGTYKPLTVFCTQHKQEVDTRPNYLVNGYNPCTKCNHMKSSGESAVLDWLSTFVPVVPRDRRVIAPKELDIYLPDQQLAVEYCGEFYHSAGSKDAERKMRRGHYDKYAACKAQGVRLITLLESEWKERNYAVRRLLRNAVGKSKGRLMARKCELRRVGHAQAAQFYERYHPQGGAGSGEHYALFWRGKMVACMRFVMGANDRGTGVRDRVWTLGRYATRVTVAGAASRLFKAFVAEYNPPVVKSFSDNRFFEGGMYEQLGFTLEAEVAPDYMVWSPKLGLRPKAHYQRRNLPKRLLDHGLEDTFDPDSDPRSEADITYLMRCRRLYDCGKKRWVWTAP